MLKRFSNSFFIIAFLFVIVSCANRGTPSGGDKDETPPEIIKTIPENYSTNFNSTEIKIYFDEYIKIKNLQRNLIISPPMDPAPEITPLGSASKFITIKIHDTLQPNTTYAFNFGESIVDNNEDNPYQFYKYVFSTGSYIDSLSVSGSISDALNRETDQFVSIMLYEIDSTFTDSVVYKQKPKYLTSTLDSTTTFQLENLKAGKYLMIALKDENSNYKFEQKSDKIGFVNHHITLPTDSIFNIKIFKEDIDFKAAKPKLLSGQKITFGYEGSHEDMKIKLLSQIPDEFNSRITKDPKSDSLLYWFKPKLEADSLVFEVSNKDYSEILTVRIKDELKDSLVIKPIQSGVLSFNDDFEIEANIPIDSINQGQINLIDKDSIAVTYQTELDTLKNRFKIKFDKTESNTYRMKLLPGSFTDFFSNKNDTLSYILKTREFSDYGNLRLTLKNAVYPVIIQLVDQKGSVKEERISTKSEAVDFRNLAPSIYYLRVIFDSNNNGKYDPGSYLLKRQAERVSYDPEPLDIRSGWDEIREFILQD